MTAQPKTYHSELARLLRESAARERHDLAPLLNRAADAVSMIDYLEEQLRKVIDLRVVVQKPDTEPT